MNGEQKMWASIVGCTAVVLIVVSVVIAWAAVELERARRAGHVIAGGYNRVPETVSGCIG